MRSFNGAATDQSRNYSPISRHPLTQSRFNGAATDQSRNYLFAHLPQFSDLPLQWGRD